MYESHIKKEQNLKATIEQIKAKLVKLEQHNLDNPADIPSIMQLVKYRNYLNSLNSQYEIAKMRAEASKLWEIHR